MCMITYLPPNVEVPEYEIMNGASWNDDGHGWAVAAETGVLLTGRYMDSSTAMETFKATRKAFPHAPAMFHSRWATHGSVSLPNVHPFMVGKFAAVAHNGILPTKFQPTKDNAHMSDTAIMANYWLAGRAQVSGIWTRKERRRIGAIIGKGNKLCILSVSPFLSEPVGYLVNAGQGTWDTATGAWFSAHDFEYGPKTRHPVKGYTGYGSGAWWDGESWDYTPLGTSAKKSAYDTCPNCGTGAEIDKRSGVCLYCDFCLDCLTELRDCQCGYPEGLILSADEAAELGEAIENPSLEEIEVAISELGTGKPATKAIVSTKPFSTPNGGKRS